MHPPKAHVRLCEFEFDIARNVLVALGLYDLADDLLLSLVVREEYQLAGID
jgi:hypothetical protein